MAVEIKRPGEGFGKKPKLSKLGKLLVFAGIAAVLLAAVLIIGAMHSAAQKKELAEPVLSAVEHSVLVCRSITGDGAEALAELIDAVEQETDVLKKADAAQEMLLYASKLSEGNQSRTDELNGARNRITVALRQYQKG